jgi:hypothetical protein
MDLAVSRPNHRIAEAHPGWIVRNLDTNRERLACAKKIIDCVGIDRKVTIDGRDVLDLRDFRVASP